MTTDLRLYGAPRRNLPRGESDTVPLHTTGHFAEANAPPLPRNVQVVVRERNSDKECTTATIFCAKFVVFIIGVIVVVAIKSGRSSSSSSSTSYSYRPSETYNPSNYDFGQKTPFSDPSSGRYGNGGLAYPGFTTYTTNSRWDNDCTSTKCRKAGLEIINSLNTSVDPCTNFYDFACGGWINRNPRPEYADEWSVFSKLDSVVTQEVISILQEPKKSSELEALSLAKDYYADCLQVQNYSDPERSRRDMQLIWDKLEQYGGWPILYKNGTWNASAFDWMSSVVGLKKEFDNTKVIDVSVYQSIDGEVSSNSLFLRNPSSVSSSVDAADDDKADMEKAERFIDAYQQFIVNVSRELLLFKGITDYNETYLNETALIIIVVANEFSKLDKTSGAQAGLSDKSEFTVKSLQDMLNLLTFWNTIDIHQLLNTFYRGTRTYIRKTQTVDVPNLYYLAAVSRLVARVREDALANYLHFQMLLEMMSLVSVEKLDQYSAAFRQAMDGTVTNYPRDQVCATKTQKKFPFALGYEFVRKRQPKSLSSSFTYGSQRQGFSKVSDMFNNIKAEYRSLVRNSNFYYVNKTLLGAELILTGLCPGHPSWITSKYSVEGEYAWLSLNQNMSYLQRNMAINKWAADKKLALISKAGSVEACKWTRFPGTVGSFHRLFKVYVPLGMLQLPFYEETLPRSLNYGRLGGIIGHEIGHGLTGLGWSTDRNGNHTPVATCLIDQYAGYNFNNDTVHNMTVDGELTLDENLADNAGLLAAYKAYKSSGILDSKHRMKGLEQYTDDQLFYIGFAQNWCETTTKESMRSSLNTDVHSPGLYRVLGTLQNSAEFTSAWKCPVGSDMNPQNKRKKCKMF